MTVGSIREWAMRDRRARIRKLLYVARPGLDRMNAQGQLAESRRSLPTTRSAYARADGVTVCLAPPTRRQRAPEPDRSSSASAPGLRYVDRERKSFSARPSSHRCEERRAHGVGCMRRDADTYSLNRPPAGPDDPVAQSSETRLRVPGIRSEDFQVGNTGSISLSQHLDH